MTTIQIVGSSFRSWRPAWEEFLTEHGDWFAQRANEAAEVHYTPSKFGESLRCVFELSKKELAAEAAYTQLCRSFRTLGLRADASQSFEGDTTFINYDHLDLFLPASDDSWLNRGVDLGWTEGQVASAKVCAANRE